MYKVLLVDDEPKIIQGLQRLIDWEDFGMEVVGTVQSAAEAMAIMEGETVHVLITDIKMPNVDGLQLIQWTKSFNRLIKCVILSGHADFPLVKEAAVLGIENYLLKPVNREELSDTLIGIYWKIESYLSEQTQLRSDAVILRNNIINRWLVNRIGRQELEQRADLLNIKFDSPYIIVSLIKILYRDSDTDHDRDLIQYAAENICSELATWAVTVCDPYGHIVSIFPSESEDKILQIQNVLKDCSESITAYLKRDVFITIGTRERELPDVHLSYKRALHLMDYSLVMPMNSIMDDSEQSPLKSIIPINIDYNQLQSCLINGNGAGVLTFIEETLSELSSVGGVSPSLVQNVTIEIAHHLLSYTHKIDPDHAFQMKNQGSLVAELQQQQNMDELRIWLSSLAQTTFQIAHLRDDDMNPIIKRILDYVDRHYMENISLKTISNAFNVNAAYMGQQFIKAMNDTFSNYLNIKRIEKAKELIMTTDLHLQEIAIRVGYHNQSYFNNMFKKHTGGYPTKYKITARALYS
ncbi:response regulator [Paenibacillus sp. FSL K6-3182]|uniref:response regulator n=1 Tax=Paenibacillus sp. FSL K6-3182 TaxID=2921495 RepID=UPI0030D20393